MMGSEVGEITLKIGSWLAFSMFSLPSSTAIICTALVCGTVVYIARTAMRGCGSASKHS